MKRLFSFFLISAIPVMGFAQAILLQEDFEQANSSFASNSASGNGSSWQTTSKLSQNGSYSDSNHVQLGDTLYLTSPVFSTLSYSEIKLNFFHIAKIYLFDKAVVEVSADSGQTWTVLDTSQYLGSGFLNGGNSFSSLSYSSWLPANNTAIPTNSWWKEETFDISIISNSANAQLRFALIDADNNGARGNYGWLIDDVLITTTGSKRQFSYLFEDFNSGIPNSWVNTAVSGNFNWMHGLMDDMSDNILDVSLDGTPMVYFNDDSLGSSHKNNTVELLSPIVSPIPNVPLILEFDYNFRDLNSFADKFRVEIYDGSNWVNIFQRTSDDCGRWSKIVCPEPSHAKINISNYINGNLQLKFIYEDGNEWAYWAAFDNVHIYNPIAYYPISKINTVDFNGVADSLYVNAWISGTVAGMDLKSNDGYSFTVIDQSSGSQAGISIYGISDVDNYVVNETDSLLLRGIVNQSNGLQQFVVDSIVQVGSNKNLAAHRLVSILNEGTESQLIRMKNLSVTSIDPLHNFVYLSTGADTIRMKVEENTAVDNLTFQLGNKICLIKGIGGQADSTDPYLGDYIITPMRASDIAFGISSPIDLGNDTIVCASANFTLDAGAGFSAYRWNTGDTTQVVSVSQADSIYVLTAINASGCESVDSIKVNVQICSALADISKDMDLEIFPNPTSGLIHFRANALQSSLEIHLLDYSGKLLLKQFFKEKNAEVRTLDLSDYPRGIYLLKLKSRDSIEIRKIVLQ